MGEYFNVDKFVNLNNIFSNLNVDNIIKIEGWENLNTKKIEKICITIFNNEDSTKSQFDIDNSENVEIEPRLKAILLKSIDLHLVKKDSIVAFIFDKSISPNVGFGIMVIEVSKVLYRIARFKLAEFLDDERVLEKVLEICEEIRREGREGKKIGTLFVIGDMEELSSYTKPLVLNPFYGYPEELRDILSNDLNETIKEYAQLDGAFIITNKGILVSAGTYIDINTDNIKRYYGWGTKHLTASAITSKTKSVCVLVSESGNVIKLFKGGKLILKY